jgi:hypothetical protein
MELTTVDGGAWVYNAQTDWWHREFGWGLEKHAYNFAAVVMDLLLVELYREISRRKVDVEPDARWSHPPAAAHEARVRGP